MAARDAAEIFGVVFDLLNDELSEEDAKRLARRLWPETFRFDFSPYQMGADAALRALNLAEMRVNPEYADEGEVMHYARKDLGGFDP